MQTHQFLDDCLFKLKAREILQFSSNLLQVPYQCFNSELDAIQKIIFMFMGSIISIQIILIMLEHISGVQTRPPNLEVLKFQ